MTTNSKNCVCLCFNVNFLVCHSMYTCTLCLHLYDLILDVYYNNHVFSVAPSHTVVSVFLWLRYEAILKWLSESVKADKGKGAADYIRTIDVKQYARHAFPLPRMAKVTSNPAEQANSGILHLHEFSPFKLLEQLWVYIQQKFKERKNL